VAQYLEAVASQISVLFDVSEMVQAQKVHW
jgi:hypothetical protein